MQLAATGGSPEVQYFTCDNDMTFWRASYQKHTLFAMESVRQEFHNVPQLGSQATCVMGRCGDLLTDCVLEVTLTKLDNSYPNAQGGYYPAEALVKDVSLVIAGQLVDRHTSDWFRIHDCLLRDSEKSEHYKRLTNFDPTTLTTELQSTETLYLPLCFSFTKHPGLCIPMVCLYYSEVKLTFTFASAEEVGVAPEGFSAAVWGDYVYLNVPERRYFLQNPHLLLLEQVQDNGGYTVDPLPSPNSLTPLKVPLSFHRPVKALFWVLKPRPGVLGGRTHHARYVGDRLGTYLSFQPSQYGSSGYGLYETISEKLAPVYDVRLTIGGVDRFPQRNGRYFNAMQPFRYTKRAPLPGIYMYSFCLSPEVVFPSGICNFSRLLDVELHLRLKKTTDAALTDPVFAGAGAEDTAKNIDEPADVWVFALSYNLLEIRDGVAQLLLYDGAS